MRAASTTTSIALRIGTASRLRWDGAGINAERDASSRARRVIEVALIVCQAEAGTSSRYFQKVDKIRPLAWSRAARNSAQDS